MPSFLTGWQRTTGGKRRSVSMLEKKRMTPETLRLSAQGHHPSTGSVWCFHLVIISSTSIPVWSREMAIYCSDKLIINPHPSIPKTLLPNMKINKPSWFVHSTKHDVHGQRGRVTLWHALPWWKDSCRSDFGSHCSICDTAPVEYSKCSQLDRMNG